MVLAFSAGLWCWLEVVTHYSSDSPPGFSSEFRAAHRTLWLVAVGIVWNHADAEDVVQEAAVVAMRKWDTCQPGTNIRAWLAEIVRNIALNYRRSNRRRTTRIEPLSDAAAADIAVKPDRTSHHARSGGSLGSLHAQLDDRIIKALEQLDMTCRSCILLRCVDGLAYDEISRLLEIPAGTAMSHVFRGRSTLAKALSPDFGVAGGRNNA